MEPVELASVDVVLIVLYFVGVAAVGVASFLRERHAARARASGAHADDFFLAGRSMGWLAVGLSLFVSNIGSEHLVGLAGTAAASGLAVGQFEWTAGLHLLVLGYLLAPIYLGAKIATLPEYLERRYSRKLRSLFSAVTLLIYAFTKLSVSVFSGETWPRYARDAVEIGRSAHADPRPCAFSSGDGAARRLRLEYVRPGHRPRPAHGRIHSARWPRRRDRH